MFCLTLLLTVSMRTDLQYWNQLLLHDDQGPPHRGEAIIQNFLQAPLLNFHPQGLSSKERLKNLIPGILLRFLPRLFTFHRNELGLEIPVFISFYLLFFSFY